MLTRRRLSDTPLDEQEQENVIMQFVTQAARQRKFYTNLLSATILFFTPSYVVLPYCRRHAILSLESLVAIGAAAFGLYRSKVRISKASCLLAVMILLQAYVTLPKITWAEIVWAFPVFGAITSILIQRWFAEVDVQIQKLQNSRYELKGA